MTKNLDAKLVLLDEEHSGRDEMNLAGNPFALLQAASKNGQTLIKREWKRTLESGKVVNARWEVNGHAELGLPGPQEEVLYLVLLQMTREAADEQGVWPQTVPFSRYELMSRLGWSGNAREYRLLRDCFARLQSVAIQADYAFWDARAKTPFASIGFSLIDEYAISDEPVGLKSRNSPLLPLSYFKWSDRLHQSFLAGNVRSLALEFTLSLNTPISKRLFRLLEVLRHARKPALSEVRLEVFSIRDRLGMTDYKYSSKIKEKLAPAVDELISRGYLDNVEYEKVRKIETAIFRFGTVGQSSVEQESAPPTPVKPTVAKSKRNTTSTPDSINEKSSSPNVRADAMKCHAIFQSLGPAEQEELLALAKAEVSPIWHDRIGLPESPMSLGLWELVAERYPEKLK